MNLPLRRMPKVWLTPLGLKSSTIFWPLSWAVTPSTICDLSVVLSSTSWVRPSAALPVKAPAKGIHRSSLWLVTASSLLMPVVFMNRNDGTYCGCPLRPPSWRMKLRSATTLAVSNS